MEVLSAEPTPGPAAEKALVSFAREGMSWEDFEVIEGGSGNSNCLY